jgi:uncharacterized protein (TIGR03437 family)
MKREIRVLLGCLLGVAAWANTLPLTVVSTAAFDPASTLAPDSAASLLGSGFTQDVRVSITGADNVERPARVLSVADNQVDLVLPADLPEGPARATVARPGRDSYVGEFVVRGVSPGLYSAGGTGKGVALGFYAKGSVAAPISTFNDARQTLEAAVLNPVGGDLYLTLVATGFRQAKDTFAWIDGVETKVRAVARRSEPGQDEVVLGPVPESLAGKGLVNVEVRADEFLANRVQVAFSPVDVDPPTFHNQIVRIFQQQCQVCHRPDRLAPFSLLDYASARPWARSIHNAVRTRSMPPWKPAFGIGSFHNERRLSDLEIDQISRWVDAGAPEGNPANAPPPVRFNDGWQAGPPDLVVRMPMVYTPKAGSDDYQCFTVPVDLKEDRFVSSVEVHPGNLKIVHHVFVYADPYNLSEFLPTREAGKPDFPCFGGPNFYLVDTDRYPWMLGAWVPGNRAISFPEGTGLRMRAGSRVVIQVHYSSNGTGGSDQSEVGIYFSKHPNPKNVIISSVERKDFTIPAGASRFRMVAEALLDIPANLRIVGLLPHMHLIGRQMRADVVTRDGTARPLISIEDWNFNWQDTYVLKEPAYWRFGETLRMEAWFDNSTGNRRNPSFPPKDVVQGENTTDEMCVLVVFLVLE